MREGRTQFVNKKQLGNNKFNQAVISLAASDVASIELIKKAGHKVENLRLPVPDEHEQRCKGCQAILARGTLFEDMCIVCWAVLAKVTNPEMRKS